MLVDMLTDIVRPDLVFLIFEETNNISFSVVKICFSLNLKLEIIELP
jgi:hypothetical protein